MSTDCLCEVTFESIVPEVKILRFGRQNDMGSNDSVMTFQ